MWERFVEPWRSVRIEVEEFVEAGEHIVTRQTGYFVGRDGIEIQVRTGWCWTFRGGALIRLLAANEVEDALEAAGRE